MYVLSLLGLLLADVPHLISYQGKLLDTKGRVVNGEHNVTFRLYTSKDDTTPIWTETHHKVQFTDGMYNLMLGSVVPFSDDIDFSQQYWLGVSIDDGDEICRYQLSSSPYALNVADNSITSEKIKNHSVTQSDIHPTVMFAEIQGNSGENKIVLTARRPQLEIVGEGLANVEIDGENHILTIRVSDNEVKNPVAWWRTGKIVHLRFPGDSVGIGTEHPSQKLDIAGNCRADTFFGDGSKLTGIKINFDTLKAYWDTTHSLGMKLLNESNQSIWMDSSSATGYWSIALGFGNSANSPYSAVVGGYGNRADSAYSFVGGGKNNLAHNLCVVGGGESNRAMGHYNVISGGYDNFIKGEHCVVLGGDSNRVEGKYSLVFGKGVTTGMSFNAVFFTDRYPGRVGINMVPSYALDVNGSINTTGDIKFTRGGATSTISPPSTPGYFHWTLPDESGELALVRQDSCIHWVRWITPRVIFTGDYDGDCQPDFLGISKATNTILGSNPETHVNLGGNSITGESGQPAWYCTIGGGLGNKATRDWATIAGGDSNIVKVRYGFIGGGRFNSITESSDGSTIAGGDTNYIFRAPRSFIGGGYQNYIGQLSDGFGTIAGGNANSIRDDYGTICGGKNNSVGAAYGFIGGGLYNIIQADDVNYAVIGGGDSNYVKGDHGVICGGNDNWADVPYSVICGGQDNYSGGLFSVICGGDTNTVKAHYGVICGGDSNYIGGEAGQMYGVICGGQSDTVKSYWGGVFSGYSNLSGDGDPDTAVFIGGGYNNTANNSYAIIGGGRSNLASGYASAIGGGIGNISTGNYSFIGGGQSNLASGMTLGYTTVCGGYRNIVTGDYSAIVGGDTNVVRSYSGFVGGGSFNLIDSSAHYSAISGGEGNTILHSYSVIGGGMNNIADSSWSTIGGGQNNTIATFSNGTICGGAFNYVRGYAATIGGGWHNEVIAPLSAVSGGSHNVISGIYSAIPGGHRNIVSGNYSFAFGEQVDITADRVAAFYSPANPGKLGINNPNPHSTLQFNGSMATNIEEIANVSPSTLDLTIGDSAEKNFTIFADGVNITNVILPPANTCKGRIYVIKNTSLSATVAVSGSGDNLIEVNPTFLIPPRESILIQSDGVNIWWIVAIYNL